VKLSFIEVAKLITDVYILSIVFVTLMSACFVRVSTDAVEMGIWVILTTQMFYRVPNRFSNKILNRIPDIVPLNSHIRWIIKSTCQSIPVRDCRICLHAFLLTIYLRNFSLQIVGFLEVVALQIADPSEVVRLHLVMLTLLVFD